MVKSSVKKIQSLENKTAELTLNRPGFLESSTAGGGGGGFRPPV